MHVEGRLPGAAGGEVYWQGWLPDGPAAVVLLSHGYAEHSGRYEHVAARLNDAAYAVYALDHRGHGRSDGTRANVDSFATVRRDLTSLREHVGDQHPHVPFFLLGHSLGGLIALDYATQGGADGLAGLLLSGPAVDPSIGSTLDRVVAPVLSRLVPNLGVATLEAEAVSRDAAVVAAYVADPLNFHGRVPARTAAETLAAVSRVARLLPSLTLPTLVLHGADDRIAAPAGARMVAERIGSEDVTLKVYDELFHEIFNEPEQAAVLDDVVDWLNRHA